MGTGPLNILNIQGACPRFYVYSPSVRRYNGSYCHRALTTEPAVFSFLDPRGANIVLGVAIGLSLALVGHWLAFAWR